VDSCGWQTRGMSARDLLHRLVDDLDEADATLVASLATDEATADVSSDVDGPQGDRILLLIKKLQAHLQNDQPGTSMSIITLVLLARPARTVDLLRYLLLPDAGAGDAAWRTDNVRDALGSVRAEGLEPSDSALQDAAAYEAGEMTAEELYAAALRRAGSAAAR
jgi:hypothetical protein